MPTGYETFPIDFSGGWITNLSRLEQGINLPGSATVLKNFEPAVNGGYTKIRGYNKFSESEVPGTGSVIATFVTDEARCLARRGETYYVSTGGAWTAKATAPISGSIRAKAALYNFNGQTKFMVVDGRNKPAIYNNDTDTMAFQTTASSDAEGAHLVVVFKNHIFLANNNNLIFLAPFTDNDYAPGNGAGIVNTGGRITGLIVFRDQLIVFHTNKIFRLVGSSEADFQLSPIAANMGCLCPHTVAEVGGDILYLGPDGVRWLSATEKQNDFGLDRASESIQSEVIKMVNTDCGYTAITIRYKNQYRLFSYIDNVPRRDSIGFVATQFSDQSSSNIEWAGLRGFKVYAADSFQLRDREIVLFCSDTNYVYRMDAGNSFDGENIQWEFQTPYMPVTDPKLRKTFYKHTLYVQTSGRLNILVRMKLDYAEKVILQPPPFDIRTGTEGVYYYDDPASTYGTARYSERSSTILYNNLIGSGFTVAFNYSGEDQDPPFQLENIIIEFAQNGRR